MCVNNVNNVKKCDAEIERPSDRETAEKSLSTVVRDLSSVTLIPLVPLVSSPFGPFGPMVSKKRCQSIRPTPFTINVLSDYLYSTNDTPVISAGFGKPIRSRTVGATSARIPSLTLATRSDTTTMGTGLSE